MARKSPQHWSAQIRHEEKCWIWTGGKSADGYGRYGGRGAHRVVFENLVGPIEPGLELDHLCGVIACVNPGHLEPVTQAENKRRRYATMTRCGKGHPFDEANTYRAPVAPRRRCRACNRAAVARYHLRKKQVSA